MTNSTRRARVYHADLWGLREDKYAWLDNNDWKTTEWREIRPVSEFYLFTPQDANLFEQYSRYIKVTDIFPVNSVGIVTARDSLTVRWTPEDVWTTVVNFSRMGPELAREAYKLGKDARDWKVTFAQEDLRQSGPDRCHIIPLLYRPFDVRFTYYTGQSRGFLCMPRPDVMRHMATGENIALITSRLTKGESFRHAQVTRHITEVICMSPKTSNNGFVFPLYLLPDGDRRDLLTTHEPSERRPNLNSDLVAALAKAYGQEPSPEEIFRYVYAVLYAPSYREKYAEFLRLDFPRIPFTSDPELFKNMAELGERLVALHLLRSPELDPPLARFRGEGDGKVIVSRKKGLRYDAAQERVYINPTQYFEGIPPEVWAYPISGYQVCHKWLKDRKDRILTLDEIRTYCRITTALSKTIEIQKETDEIYPAVEESVLAIDSGEGMPGGTGTRKIPPEGTEGSGSRGGLG